MTQRIAQINCTEWNKHCACSDVWGRGGRAPVPDNLQNCWWLLVRCTSLPNNLTMESRKISASSENRTL